MTLTIKDHKGSIKRRFFYNYTKNYECNTEFVHNKYLTYLLNVMINKKKSDELGPVIYRAIFYRI